MKLTKMMAMAQQQMQNPKRRAQVEKLVGTAKSKIASRNKSGPASPPAGPSSDRPDSLS